MNTAPTLAIHAEGSCLIENRFEEIIVADIKVGIVLEMFMILIWRIIGLEELVSELPL